MNESLRIAVADDEPLMLHFFEDTLVRLGHQVVAAAENGKQLIELCRKQEPDMVITDVKMPLMDGLEAAAAIYEERPVPIVVVSAHHDPEFIQRAGDNHILAYLLKPIKDSDLGPAISIAIQRFAEFQALEQEASNLRQALDDRKVIERAKGILMKQAKLDEQAAFRRLQKLARDNNQKLVEVAKMIVVAVDAIRPNADD